MLSFYWVMLEADNKYSLHWSTECNYICILPLCMSDIQVHLNIAIWKQGGCCRFINSLKCVFDVSYPPPQHEVAPTLQKQNTLNIWTTCIYLWVCEACASILVFGTLARRCDIGRCDIRPFFLFPWTSHVTYWDILVYFLKRYDWLQSQHMCSNCCTRILCQNSIMSIPVPGYINF